MHSHASKKMLALLLMVLLVLSVHAMVPIIADAGNRAPHVSAEEMAAARAVPKQVIARYIENRALAAGAPASSSAPRSVLAAPYMRTYDQLSAKRKDEMLRHFILADRQQRKLFSADATAPQWFD